MDGVVDLGTVRRERAYLASIARQHPDTRTATSFDEFTAHLGPNGEGSETMVRQIKKLCEGCGREYYATRSDQRFHSAACKAQHHRDIQAVEEGAPIDLLAQALIRAFSLRVAGSVEAPAALGALLPLLLAEVEPSTPLTPEPIAAPVVASPTPEPIAAPAPIEAPTNEAVRERLKQAKEGHRLNQKELATACGISESVLSRFIKGTQKTLVPEALELVDRYLTEHERSLKPS